MKDERFQFSLYIWETGNFLLLSGNHWGNLMETLSLKALSKKIISGNNTGKSEETLTIQTGNFDNKPVSYQDAVERVAYRIYSETLACFLWVVAEEADMKTLRATRNITEVIYTDADIQKLRSIDKEVLKAVHRVKEVFPLSLIEEISIEGKP